PKSVRAPVRRWSQTSCPRSGDAAPRRCRRVGDISRLPPARPSPGRTSGRVFCRPAPGGGNAALWRLKRLIRRGFRGRRRSLAGPQPARRRARNDIAGGGRRLVLELDLADAGAALLHLLGGDQDLPHVLVGLVEVA